jgi:hypothetical protein
LGQIGFAPIWRELAPTLNANSRHMNASSRRIDSVAAIGSVDRCPGGADLVREVSKVL